MRTLLIGWELGGGRGHIERLVPIVAAFRAQGWRVVTALRNSRQGAEIIGRHQSHIATGRLEIIQAPVFSRPSLEAGSVHSLAEIMAGLGFSKPDLVRPLIAGWEAILARYRPDVVISDSAPSLNVVAHGRVPLIVIGNGWTIPSDTDPLPVLVHGLNADRLASSAADAVLSAICTALPSERLVNRFSDLLRGDLNMVCSLGETDPYREQRSERLYWPFEIAAPAIGSPDGRSGGMIYFPKNHPGRKLVERNLANIGMHFDAFFADGQKCVSPNLTIHNQPINFEQTIPTRRLAIHHGGLGTTIWCIVNQVPQVILPADLEKLLIANSVMKLGYGISIEPNTSGSRFTQAVSAAVALDVPRFDSHKMMTLSPQASLDALLSAQMTLAG